MANKNTYVAIIPRKVGDKIAGLPLSRIQKNKCVQAVEIILGRVWLEEDKDTTDYQLLASNWWEEVFNKKYHTFLKVMLAEGIIEYNGFYRHVISPFNRTEEGVPKGYRVNPELLTGEFQTIAIETTKELTTENLIMRQTNRDNTYTHPTNDTADKIYHIIPHLFPKSALVNDLASLTYDEAKLEARMQELIAGVSMANFLVGEGITRASFHAKNRIKPEYSVKKKYLGRNYQISKAKELGGLLIQDGSKFYIDKAENFLETKRRNMEIHFGKCMAEIRNKYYRPERNTTNNRLDHTLTSMNKELMAIIMEDNSLAEIDICNSQFAIHANWMCREGKITERDAGLYYQIATQGCLYEELKKIFGVDRAKAKLMMMEMSFSSHNNPSANKKTFKAQFPSVVKHIDDYKQRMGDSAEFSNQLADIEAFLMVDNVYPVLKGMGMFAVTKHDSVIVKKEDLERAVEAIDEFFMRVNFSCTLNVNGRLIQVGPHKPFVKMDSDND